MTEDALHIHLCKYIKLQYPKVFFNSDMSGDYLGSGGHKNFHQARKVANKRSSKGFPDLVIYHKNSNFVGLAIELKALDKSPFKKDGMFKKAYAPGGEKHDQVIWLKKFKEIGFEAKFGIGYEDAKSIIDEYLTPHERTEND